VQVDEGRTTPACAASAAELGLAREAANLPTGDAGAGEIGGDGTNRNSKDSEDRGGGGCDIICTSGDDRAPAGGSDSGDAFRPKIIQPLFPAKC
jgi:hypothetical protein